MSVKAMSWALYEVPELKPTTRLVLAILADHAGHDGTGAFPSQKTIGAAVGIDPRNIRGHLQELVRLGVIKKGDQRHVQHIPANYRPTVYDLCLDEKERLAAVMLASGLGGMRSSGLGGMKSASRGDVRGDASIPQTNKPKDKPVAGDLTPTVCTSCDRVRPARLISESGICADCIAMADPSHTATVQAGLAYRLELVNKRRARQGLPPLEALEAEG